MGSRPDSRLIIIEAFISFAGMKQEAPRERDGGRKTVCPECSEQMPSEAIKHHILTCKLYVPTYLNNVRRFVQHISPNYLEFLITEMDMIKEDLIRRVAANRRPPGPDPPLFSSRPQYQVERDKADDIRQARLKEGKKEELKEQPQAGRSEEREGRSPRVEQTLQLEDLYGPNYPFVDAGEGDEFIECADPSCSRPAKGNDIERYTYLEDCLHTICLYCFRNYVRNSFVKSQGELMCPRKDCEAAILYIQIKHIVDPVVLCQLEQQLNSQAFHLIQCQKCHEQYQFEKGRASDAPKKTPEGTLLPPEMASHYAENRFQCPKCRQEQCQQCKEVPYHLGHSCPQFQEHKAKKKCRYCRKGLAKGYMSKSGIHAFDDICESGECVQQMKEGCSKKLVCGHSCGGVIKEKQCLPCLKEGCALKASKELHGENEASYCSLCYVESLGEAPSIQSKCGHIFHLKCLRKRLELKWGTPRITFRFCECPLCNQWMEVPPECPLSKQLEKFRGLWGKIKDKAVRRLKHEKEDEDPKLTDPKSPYFKDEGRYSMAIYAYFECHDCGEAFFGGRKSCAEAMNEGGEEKFDPKELICPSCCPVQVSDCKKHGKEYISFKCRFCCSVAQWFCWGNTHFCDACHKKQISGQYVSRTAKDKLPKCPGKPTCPVGGEHGANGEEFCLGCGICRGDKLQAQQDF